MYFSNNSLVSFTAMMSSDLISNIPNGEILGQL